MFQWTLERICLKLLSYAGTSNKIEGKPKTYKHSLKKIETTIYKVLIICMRGWDWLRTRNCVSNVKLGHVFLKEKYLNKEVSKERLIVKYCTKLF